MHMIQGPTISKRIVDNSDVTERDLEIMHDMTIGSLGAGQ